MLVDKVDIHVKAGKGGNGSVSFRREKYVSHGGPDGGDGGNGGSVILVPDQGESTLLAYKYNRKFIAEDGENGSNKKFHGRNGEDVLLRVPLGTVVRDRDTGTICPTANASLSRTAAEGDGATSISPRPRARRRILLAPVCRAKSFSSRSNSKCSQTWA